MSSKEALLSRLMQPDTTPQASSGKSLIQVVGGDDEPIIETSKAEIETKVEEKPVLSAKTAQDDQPSILEMMMAAQREAKAEKEKETTKAADKGLGGGFKKGFFGSEKSSKPKNATTSNSTSKNSATDVKSTSTAPASTATKPGLTEVKKNTSSSTSSNPLVFEEVQKAMDADTHPLLKQLQSNDWMTPDLVSNFQSNQVVSNGFKNPKCMAAMQLLQTNPTEAQHKYKNDPEVSLFLQEFAKLMAGHFESLGNSKNDSSSSGGGGNGGGKGSSGKVATNAGANLNLGSAANPKSSRVEEIGLDNLNIGTGPSGSGGIQEIGPLHAQVLQKKKEQTSATSTPSPTSGADIKVAKPTNSFNNKNTTTTATNSNTGSKKPPVEDEEERVKMILQDDELRTMLMDPELQRILMECGDPAKFQQHMRNPETYRKIVKLQQAGLVGTAR